jgi:hypothetical protein
LLRDARLDFFQLRLHPEGHSSEGTIWSR